MNVRERAYQGCAWHRGRRSISCIQCAHVGLAALTEIVQELDNKLKARVDEEIDHADFVYRLVGDDGQIVRHIESLPTIQEKAEAMYPHHAPTTALANYLAGREVWDTNGDPW